MATPGLALCLPSQRAGTLDFGHVTCIQEDKAKAKDLHPKLLAGMFFSSSLNGITAFITSDKPIFESFCSQDTCMFYYVQCTKFGQLTKL